MRIALIFLATVAACGAGDKSAGAPAATDSTMLVAELPGLAIDLDSGAITKPGIRLRTFGFRSTQGDWPMGKGIAVFTESGRLAWIHLANGELQPHSIGVADFDADGRNDIIYYAGHEETFETTVLLNRIARDSFAVSNFTLGHRDDRSYEPVLDFDGDGKPELLMPSPSRGDEESDGPSCAAPLSEPPLKDEVRAEYFRLAGRFDSLNFRYGMATEYPDINMFMYDSIRILSLTTQDRLVTGRFRKHLDWRIGILKRARESADPSCHRQIDDLISYLASPR